MMLFLYALEQLVKKSSGLIVGKLTVLAEGGVAYGAEYKGENNYIHRANEFASVERLKQDIKVYAETIIRLCK